MTTTNRKTIEANEIAFYEEIYKNEAYNPTGNRLRLNREINSLKKLSGLKKFNRVLSIGCGHGEFELLLAPHAEHITAVDLSSDAIELAKRNQSKADITNVDFRCQSFNDISWDEHFDVITCIAFLHHVPKSKLLNFLKQAYNHLSPNGFFYSQDPNIHGILRTVGRLILGKNYDKYHTPDERELDPKEMIDLFKKVGFNPVNISYMDLTLIPGLYMFTRGLGWLMHLFLLTDSIWQKTLFSRWASGFAMIGWKK